MSINLGGADFDGPFQLDDWTPPRQAAVYAILMRRDPVRKPKTYRPIYFGETEDLSERGFLRAHHKFGCWINEAGSTKNLFIAIYALTSSTEAKRRSVEARLVSDYEPECND
jgi:hypothetical protein